MLIRRLLALALLLCAVGAGQDAPGAPGAKATWTNGNKQGVGTAYSRDSKVWFTLGGGTLNEVYYPTIDKANTRNLELIVTDGATFTEVESEDTGHAIEIPDESSLVFKQVNTSRKGLYRIEKTYIADPERPVVLINVRFTPLKKQNMRLYVYFDAAMNNSGLKDRGATLDRALVASEGNVAAALLSSIPFARTTSGFAGVSDGLAGLRQSHKLAQVYRRAANGNIVQIAQLPSGANSFTLALGFGKSAKAAAAAAQQSLHRGFVRTLTAYSAEWKRYLSKLRPVNAKYMAQYRMAAMMLKAHEDKTYIGAGAASLTVPWGHQADANKDDVGGYHLVWSRDLYQVATAFLAMGDRESAAAALDYLFTVQQRPDGSFPQNSWLDGRPFWPSLQLDEVAFPIILAWQLERTDAVTYTKNIKPAATFLVKRGPSTPQERWEEEAGYSPSTIAAEIAGLICAAAIADKHNDFASAMLWRATADDLARRLDSWTVVPKGPYGERYFLRIAQNGDPAANRTIEINNGSGNFKEQEIVDAGFLELVRLGIRPPDDPTIRRSLAVIDKVIRVETPNGPGWYRYNHDGYGEKADGRGYDGTGIGRLWPLLTGERGEYALAAGNTAEAQALLDAMLAMANEGRMLPEQVWDRAESPEPKTFRFGEGTGSATPLAWTNAQFIRLAIALEDGKLPETPAIVQQHFAGRASGAGGAARVAITPVPASRVLRPGETVEIGALAEGKRAVLAVDGVAREVKPARVPIQVKLGAETVRIALVAVGENGESVLDQLTLTPRQTDEERFAGVDLKVPAPSPDDAAFAEALKSEASPIIRAPWVTFVYRGPGKEVEVVGEFTDWDKRGYKMRPLAGTGPQYLSMQFPSDARIEYKFIVDGEWQLDPLNPNKKDNGVGGENNFFTMPGYTSSPLAAQPAAPAGQLEDLTFGPEQGVRRIQVYLPAGYERGAQRYPTVYFADGGEYISRARAPAISDSLVAGRRMRPAILVFISPVDRTREYWLDPTYVKMLVEKIVPAVDAKYRTIPEPASRAVAGPSLGGLVSAFAALAHPEVFGNVIGQSSAFLVNQKAILAQVAGSGRKPLRWYLEVGTYEGLLDVNREMKRLLEEKGYPVVYREVNAGHNWTHWAEMLPEALASTFPAR